MDVVFPSRDGAVFFLIDDLLTTFTTLYAVRAPFHNEIS